MLRRFSVIQCHHSISPPNACYERDLDCLANQTNTRKGARTEGDVIAICFRGDLSNNLYTGNDGFMGWSESQDLKKPEFVFEHVAAGDYIIVYNDQERMIPIHRTQECSIPGVGSWNRHKSFSGGGRKLAVWNSECRVDERPGQSQCGCSRPGESCRTSIMRRGRGNDGSSLSKRLSKGVFRIMVFPGIRYEMQGSGYCSANEKS